MPPRRRLVLILLLLIGVFLAAAGVIRLMGSRATAPPPPPPAPEARSFPRAPDMQITMYQGQNLVGGSVVRLSQVWARKPVVVNFYAGLCPPCRAEMPDLQRLIEEPGSGRFILISVDIGPYTGLGSREEGKALLHTLGIRFPAGTVYDEDVVDAYRIVGMPTTVFITQGGGIVRRHVGQLTFEQMKTFTEGLVKASSTR